MRQAGRILEPYRQLKEKTGSIQALFDDPELVTQITLMPVDMLEVDAAILFADIFTPVIPMGCDIVFAPGPTIGSPVRTQDDVAGMREYDPEQELSHVAQAIGEIGRALPPSVPLIGFAGAPFTLATYLVEGGSAKEYSLFRRMLHHDSICAHALMSRLTDITIAYLQMQVRAGVQVIQLFDTCVGALSAEEFTGVCRPYLDRIFAALESSGVPRIYFGLGATHLLHGLGELAVEALSVDWRTDMAVAFDLMEGKKPHALQGNLNPCALFGSPEHVESVATELLKVTADRPHVFNLGHGVHPETPYDQVKRLVDTVHAFESSN
jgi:uroporphyrinogen decarboxylase